MDDATPYHVPVLLDETVKALLDDVEGTYVDVTFGAGGHARAILEHLGRQGKLYAFDQDLDARENAMEDPRLHFTQANFRFLDRFLRYYGVFQVDGLMADLGVSSHQFDREERGFSYRSEEKLDMRMNRGQKLTAADVLNRYSFDRLVGVFSDYGQVRNAKTLAGLILTERDQRPISTIPDLIHNIERVSRGNPVRYMAQVFQAIRIEVNDEMDSLRKLLQTSAKFIKPGGSLVVLTYHSVEDRLVKHFVKDSASGFRLSGKPIVPTAEEIAINPRASSAKLRVAYKVE